MLLSFESFLSEGYLILFAFLSLRFGLATCSLETGSLRVLVERRGLLHFGALPALRAARAKVPKLPRLGPLQLPTGHLTEALGTLPGI